MAPSTSAVAKTECAAFSIRTLFRPSSVALRAHPNGLESCKFPAPNTDQTFSLRASRLPRPILLPRSSGLGPALLHLVRVCRPCPGHVLGKRSFPNPYSVKSFHDTDSVKPFHNTDVVLCSYDCTESSHNSALTCIILASCLLPTFPAQWKTFTNMRNQVCVFVCSCVLCVFLWNGLYTFGELSRREFVLALFCVLGMWHSFFLRLFC